MADINQTECQMCGAVYSFKGNEYSDIHTCPKCHMSHEWDEGACALLTAEEKAAVLAIRKLNFEVDE